jgi:hypothetical protein
MSKHAYLALIFLAGCATPVHNGVPCSKTNPCPSGETCESDGTCHPNPVGDGGSGDMSQKPCKVDADCSGATPRCHASDGKCVPCLPTNDNCPKGKSCQTVNGGYQCVAGCTVDADCGAAGMGMKLRCCNKLCIDVNHDDMNCGSCASGCGMPSCCGGTCLNTAADLMNCGGCGIQCMGKNATWKCSNSACTVASCNPGFGDCNGMPADGCETPLSNDPKNCGTCGKVCMIANAMTTCTNSVCSVTKCSQGYGDCDNNPANGCEVMLGSDPNNCGMCGTKCSGLPNANANCMNAMCVIGMCLNGFSDCDKVPGNGCEADLNNDPNNCGACGMKCAAENNATVGCSGGKCVITGCSPGFGDCDKQYGNGCEKDVSSDVNNCGACGMTCPGGPNVTTVACQNSACRVTGCNNGFADCDKQLGNGCEVNTQNDVNNCNGCGAKCQVNQACTNGVCTNNRTLVGQYNVHNGPNWNNNPPTYTCIETCAMLFGAGNYNCSTSFATINNQAWASEWGDLIHCNNGMGVPVAENYKLNTFYNCGNVDCSVSAYVQDNCYDNMSINYCWK